MTEKKEKDIIDPIKEAVRTVFDAVGVRAICAFAEAVFRLAEWLREQPSLQVLNEKDYFANPKPSGYRSYHMIVLVAPETGVPMRAEIQIRTIAMDFWATLEHQLKNKKDVPHEALIRSELKRCADEIASVDISMQTIRDVLRRIE